MKDLTKDELNWLLLRKSIIHIGEDFAICVSTDGHRVHGIHLDKMPSKIEGKKMRKLVGILEEHKTIDSVLVNPYYLVEALQGMDSPIRLSVARCDDSTIAVIVEDSQHHKAIVMCMKDNERKEQNE